MTELFLRYWPDPVLTTPTEPIHPSRFGVALADFGDDLIACMLRAEGIGLAGPQVGVAVRMFAMQFIDNARADLYPPIVVCNPVILELSSDMEYNVEGCLSLPDVRENVARASEVVLAYQTAFGEHREMVLHNLEARIVQHEVDHLDGLLFIDRLSPTLRRRLLRTMAHPAEV